MFFASVVCAVKISLFILIILWIILLGEQMHKHYFLEKQIFKFLSLSDTFQIHIPQLCLVSITLPTKYTIVNCWMMPTFLDIHTIMKISSEL